MSLVGILYVLLIKVFNAMRFSAFVFICLSSVGLLLGCGQEDDPIAQPQNDPIAQPQNDPVTQLQNVFEDVVKPSIENGGVFDPGDDLGQRIIGNARVAEPKYDVQKTDSLVTPYTGIIENAVVYTLEIPSKGTNEPSTLQCRTTYAYQDGQWVSQTQEFFMPELSDMGWQSFAGQNAVPSVACGFIE